MLYKIAGIYDDMGEKQKALDYYGQSLEASRQATDLKGEAQTLNNIGYVYSSLGEKQKALEYYNRALAIKRQISDHGGEANTLFNMGTVYSALGDKLKALGLLNQALPIYQYLKNHAGEAAALNNLASIYDGLGDKQKALEYFNQALLIRQRLFDENEEAGILSNIAGVYSSMGEKQKALKHYDQALTLARRRSNWRTEALVLTGIGKVHEDTGEYQKALEYYTQALPLRRQVLDPDGEATTLNNMGTSFLALGEPEKALEHFNRALPIFRKTGNQKGLASAMDNIAAVYFSLSEIDRGLSYLYQALPIYRQLIDRGGEAMAVNNIGVFYSSLDEQQKALEYFSQALPLRQQVRDRDGEAVTLSNLAVSYENLGEHQKALGYCNQALSIAREVGDRRLEANILNNIGAIYNNIGSKQRALEHFNESLQISQQIKDPQLESKALTGISVIHRDLGKLEVARTYIEMALGKIDTLRNRVIAEQLRMSYLSSNHNVFTYYVDLLMRLHQQHPTEGFDAAALQAGERGRARSLLELLNESHANITQGVEPAVLARKRAVGQLLDAKAERLTRLLNGNHSKDQTDAAKAEVDNLKEQYERIETQIREKSPAYAALTQPQTLSLNEIQQLLDPDTLFLEYALGPERSYLWAVTQTSFKSYALPKAYAIEALAIKLRRSLQAPGPVRKSQQAAARAVPVQTAAAAREVAGLAEKLSAMLLSPVASMLSDKRLVIVLDGALEYLPFAVLADPAPKAKGEPLLLRHEIVSLPSASALAIQRRTLDSRKPSPKTAIVFADPVFSGDDIRVNRSQKAKAAAEANPFARLAVEPASVKRASAQARETATNEPLYRLALMRAVGDAGLATIRGELPRLLGTRTEGEQIVALAGTDKSKLVVDFAADRASVKSDELENYRYVHLATHGLLDTQNPELSALVLSLVDEHGQQQDGYLRAHEIFNLSLPAEVVVLSACQTGLGKNLRGEGLVGLTRGFMYAGAKRVVVSLWSVDDASTAELMIQFYSGMLKEGKRPAEALRQAQLRMLMNQHNPQWRAPYYWAPFILQGEWR